jgi:hypothetical protein
MSLEKHCKTNWDIYNFVCSEMSQGKPIEKERWVPLKVAQAETGRLEEEAYFEGQRHVNALNEQNKIIKELEAENKALTHAGQILSDENKQLKEHILKKCKHCFAFDKNCDECLLTNANHSKGGNNE